MPPIPFKVLVCGPEGAGKSSLINRLSSNSFGLTSASTSSIHTRNLLVDTSMLPQTTYSRIPDNCSNPELSVENMSFEFWDSFSLEHLFISKPTVNPRDHTAYPRPPVSGQHSGSPQPQVPFRSPLSNYDQEKKLTPHSKEPTDESSTWFQRHVSTKQHIETSVSPSGLDQSQNSPSIVENEESTENIQQSSVSSSSSSSNSLSGDVHLSKQYTTPHHITSFTARDVQSTLTSSSFRASLTASMLDNISVGIVVFNPMQPASFKHALSYARSLVQFKTTPSQYGCHSSEPFSLLLIIESFTDLLSSIPHARAVSQSDVTDFLNGLCDGSDHIFDAPPRARSYRFESDSGAGRACSTSESSATSVTPTSVNLTPYRNNSERKMKSTGSNQVTSEKQVEESDSITHTNVEFVDITNINFFAECAHRSRQRLIVGFHSVSALTGEGIEELLESICRVCRSDWIDGEPVAGAGNQHYSGSTGIGPYGVISSGNRDFGPTYSRSATEQIHDHEVSSHHEPNAGPHCTLM